VRSLTTLNYHHRTTWCGGSPRVFLRFSTDLRDEWAALCLSTFCPRVDALRYRSLRPHTQHWCSSWITTVIPALPAGGLNLSISSFATFFLNSWIRKRRFGFIIPTTARNTASSSFQSYPVCAPLHFLTICFLSTGPVLGKALGSPRVTFDLAGVIVACLPSFYL